MNANAVVFRKGHRLGQPDAESDGEYLDYCFLNNGTLDQAGDISSKQCILLGRTGSGKSALLKRLGTVQGNVVNISPDLLALHHVANSATISFFEEAGVHLDGFYILLWKHILSVELLRKRYKINDDRGQRRFMDQLSDIGRRDRSKEAAIEYLQKWGEKFWIATDHRTAEFTRKLETTLEGSGAVAHFGVKLGGKGAKALTEEQKGEVVQHGQRAVSEIQIRELAKVVELLADDIFPSDGEPYFLCIDDLDGDWAPDAIRFKLIKALFETIKAFQQIRSVKIVVTMRTDLVYSLYRSIQSPGFQSEKFSGYYLHLKWTRQDLSELLNRRVHHLFRFQYHGDEVGLHDILPTYIAAKVRSIEYILERTFFRPREAIAFLNRCIEKGEGKSKITPQMIKDAEYIYSEDRLTALCDEWRREFPNLRRFCNLLRGFADGSEVGHLRNKKLETFCLELPADLSGEEAILSKRADDAAMDCTLGGLPFLRELLKILYSSGLVGLKLYPTTVRVFSFHDDVQIDAEHIELTSRVYVHKAFWVTLGIKSSEFDTRLL